MMTSLVAWSDWRQDKRDATNTAREFEKAGSRGQQPLSYVKDERLGTRVHSIMKIDDPRMIV